MPELITRCPKCATAFRISDNLLQSAKGMVRCGSCLQVFNAREHLEPRLETPASPPVAPQPQPHSPPPPETPQPPISISGFLKRQDADDETETFAPTPSAAHSSHSENAGLFERHEPQQTEQDELEEEDDEAWALELLKDDSDLNVQFKKIVENPRPAGGRSEEHLTAAAADERESRASGGPDSRTSPEVDADILPQQHSVEAAAPNMDELLAEIETTTEDASQPETGTEAGGDGANTLTQKHEAPPPLPSAATPMRAKSSGEPHAPTTAVWTPRPIRENIAAIEPEPLEVDWNPSPSWKKRLLWPLLALVALLALLGQVAWLEFHRLNTVEPYRSFYAVACQYLECTLPDLVDRSKIDTSQLVVRSHPEIENALKVDVILKNNAEFEQSFPTLLLTFSNLRSEPVASRRLTPDEYLGGELAGQTMMPVRQPIHIGLEIVDPGEQAVSYSIAIVD